MPRQPRVVIKGMPHHVTQRGNYQQMVFENHEDFRKYCCLAATYADEYGIEIMAYCLMSNHVHFIVIPLSKDSLARFFGLIQTRYSQYKNKQKEKKGHLWQGRFYSNALDNVHLLRAIRYVERNPVQAQIVEHAWDYVWSSARYHTGMDKDPIIKTVGTQKIVELTRYKNWEEYLQEEDGFKMGTDT